MADLMDVVNDVAREGKEILGSTDDRPLKAMVAACSAWLAPHIHVPSEPWTFRDGEFTQVDSNVEDHIEACSRARPFWFVGQKKPFRGLRESAARPQ